ncbi:MAG: hypothetical protein JJU29_19865 [Verrucomicrobia bacterium]|nr:hypothetical protein [Verrucomicrobiota bacterium]MCH8514236.1 hypothetical protein [Kiritimatiellia bacterium]
MDSISKRAARRLQTSFDGRFVIAVVGSSGHGKTTIIDEMFPSLASKGWLETDVTDTTSQALKIEYNDQSDGKPPVVVNSWTLSQIKGMFSDAEVERQNERNGITITYEEDHIVVDGRQANFNPSDAKHFKFPKILDVYPFDAPFIVPEAKQRDKDFISALTVKQASKNIKTPPLFQTSEKSYNTLQLRAVVKDVTLKDDYKNIRKWTGLDEDQLDKLVFVDTPGIGTSGSIKDEILTHTLESKSRRVLLELFANDELDIIVHLVLCGRQSDFANIWKSLEETMGPGEMEDLAERIVLAINGTNIFFSNADLNRHMTEHGDHLDTAIGDNIIEKMAPGRHFKPGIACFLDSKRIVESGGFLKAGNYAKTYEGYRPVLESWMTKDSPAAKFLETYGWSESFRENIDALCDPEDRGQGFLTRKIQELISTKGDRLFAKKYLVRSGLLSVAQDLKEITTEFYDAEGGVNSQATLEAIKGIMSFLDKEDPLAIEKFALQSFDAKVDEITEKMSGPGWVMDSFEKVCSAVYHHLVEQTGAPAEVQETFWRVFLNRAQEWSEIWGYAYAILPTPAESKGRTIDLVRHSLKMHVREMLYQFQSEGYSPEPGTLIEQSTEDKDRVLGVIHKIEKQIEVMKSICKKVGVLV